jgi:hypothetical protein
MHSTRNFFNSVRSVSRLLSPEIQSHVVCWKFTDVSEYKLEMGRSSEKMVYF